MVEFSKDSILKAIENIDLHPELRKGRESIEYDLVYNDKKYPPILVLSEANKLLGGNELLLSDFGNSTRIPFKKLQELGFILESKKTTDNSDNNVKIWIEKTLVQGRKDRIEGEYALGKRLWSPERDKRNADIYSSMRVISENDIILHFTDNSAFTGVSKVRSKFIQGMGVQGSEWEGPAYIVELKNFTKILPLPRNSILNEKNRALLEEIKSGYRVFYNSELNLNQGAYITECPVKLAQLINLKYYQINGEYIPYLPLPSLEVDSKFNDKKMAPFDIKFFLKSIQESNIYYNERIVNRFVFSLISKGFLILTGLSGSGKTKLALSFCKWICQDESQYCLVPVGADWTNREPLLGYPNALENEKYVLPDNGALNLIIKASKSENQSKPYFLILDEMNLSHVERYFADFLSAMESSESIPLHSGGSEWDGVPSKVSIPKNLFIIGTVNIDETTYMFSPKVLDRANVIEFRVTEKEMLTYLGKRGNLDMSKLRAAGAEASTEFIQLSLNQSFSLDNQEELNSLLLSFFKELKKTGAEFGYRTANEILRFAGIVKNLEPSWSIEEISDAAIMQKLLPKLHGSRRKLEPVLKTLGSLCLKDGQHIDEVLSPKFEGDFTDASKFRFPLSIEKISRMHRGLLDNGFTSFAEA